MSLALAISPDRRARSMRFFTEEGDHLEPPRVVRSCSRSSWVAISRSVRFGFDEWIPATSDPRAGGEGICAAMPHRPSAPRPSISRRGEDVPASSRGRVGSIRGRYRPKCDPAACAERSEASDWPFPVRVLRTPLCAAVILASASGRRSRMRGLQGSLPLDFAALIPAFVRSEISARSSCATAPSTWSENIPCGVDVSIGWRSDRKCAFFAVRSSITSSRWLTDRARRSRRTTMSVSPALISRSSLDRAGRARDAPDPCF